MELLNHIGLYFQNELDLGTLVVKIKGLFVLMILFAAAVTYKWISIGCFWVYDFFPESINNIKKTSSSAFWGICLYFLQLNNVKFEVKGDPITSDSAVVISNHQSLADHFVMPYLAANAVHSINDSTVSGEEAKQAALNKIVLPRINFFSWFRVWNVPSIRVLLNMAKCDENWELDSTLSELIFSRFLRTKVPEWIVLFPEVNIWTEEAAILQKAQSEKFYLPVLKNVLYPRFSSFYNVISVLNNKANYKFVKLYDLTILYKREPKKPKSLGGAIISALTPRPPEEPVETYFQPSLLDIVFSKYPITVQVTVKTKFLNRIPLKRKKTEKWLENLWLEKDKNVTQTLSSVLKQEEPTGQELTPVPLSPTKKIPVLGPII